MTSICAFELYERRGLYDSATRIARVHARQASAGQALSTTCVCSVVLADGHAVDDVLVTEHLAVRYGDDPCTLARRGRRHERP